MDGGEPERWSAVAPEWSRLWAGVAAPVWDAVLAAAGVAPGRRVLDVGCGSGELLEEVARRGAVPAGLDPAAGMVALARARLPGADVRIGSAERLPWPDASFELVTTVNALQFAPDTLEALAECTRVTVPGGHVAVANWAEDARNDLDVIEAALAEAAGEPPLAGGDLRQPGGLRRLLADGGLEVVAEGLVETPWTVPDDDTLVHAVLMGEDPAVRASSAPTVLAAARPFRRDDGSYRLVNAFRYAVGRTPATVRPGRRARRRGAV